MKLKIYYFLFVVITSFTLISCEEANVNKTAKQEQQLVEQNQARLNQIQPSPSVDWSMERKNLISRFLLMNDRGVVFYMYLFIHGVKDPIGYYQVNKVSSVNSQLTNPMQLVYQSDNTGPDYHILPSPQEDGSYGTNGDAVFGFTPDNIYIEHNLPYIVATAPLSFSSQPQQLANVSVETLKELQNVMDRLNIE
jgi:hypothetical protein